MSNDIMEMKSNLKKCISITMINDILLYLYPKCEICNEFASELSICNDKHCKLKVCYRCQSNLYYTYKDKHKFLKIVYIKIVEKVILVTK